MPWMEGGPLHSPVLKGQGSPWSSTKPAQGQKRTTQCRHLCGGPEQWPPAHPGPPGQTPDLLRVLAQISVLGKCPMPGKPWDS
jgi:hypothetical protein